MLQQKVESSQDLPEDGPVILILFFCLCFLVVPTGWTGVKNWKMLFKLAILDDLLKGVCGGSFLPAGEFPGMMDNFGPKQLNIFFHHIFVHCSTCSDTNQEASPTGPTVDEVEIQLTR